MDDDNPALIVMLCTRIGMIMEDHGELALTIGTTPRGEWMAALDRLENTSGEIGVLAKAGKVLLARA